MNILFRDRVLSPLLLTPCLVSRLLLMEDWVLVTVAMLLDIRECDTSDPFLLPGSINIS